jgi:ATP-dependent protease ClpP protease subunit
MWNAVHSELWVKEAEDGRLWIPHEMEDVEAKAIILAVRRARFVGRDIDVYVNTRSGLISIWNIVSEMEALSTLHEVRTYAYEYAYSAGLFIAAAGSDGSRVAHPNTGFIFHGDGSPKHKSKHQDAHRINFMVRHSNKPAEFWADIISSGENFKFSAEEALEFGVIDAISEDHIWGKGM